MKVRRKKSDSMTNEMKGVVDGFQDRATHANLPKLGGQIAALFFLREKGGEEKEILTRSCPWRHGIHSLQEHKDPALDDLSYCWSLPSYSEL
jgi:hypothetical protein